jgi:hypothetical protein
MVSRAEALKALRKLQREPLDIDKTAQEVFAHDEIFGSATQDRAIALVAATALDEFLKAAILTRLIKLTADEHEDLFGPNVSAPLSSFSARIKIGYALGLYDRQFREDLDLVRAIRNTFAHTLNHIDFETPAVNQACDFFQLAPTSLWGVPRENASAKDRYTFITAMRGVMLGAKAKIAADGSTPPPLAPPA